MSEMPPTKDDWPFDEECPRCGESIHIGAVVTDTSDEDDPTEADMVCGTDVTGETGIAGSGCGHSWEWERGQE